ncbi:TlpA family protein disulfide reductase [Dysgonomonas sp. OttesenSCG-928-M03]|nr:TlpA family protein disulfide reductase [Dysgonomonas sp. OttesenSCG-928-M03]
MRTFLLLFCFVVIVTSCRQEKDIRTLTITIDESINSQPQWLYWFYAYGNEYSIIDSCYIEEGQTELILHDTIMNDSICRTELILSEMVLPWEKAFFKIDSRDRDIKIHNLTSNGIGSITGALAEEESKRIWTQKRVYKGKISELREDFLVSDYNDTLTLSRITKEIEDLKEYLAHDLIIEQFDSVQSTTTMLYLLMDLGDRVKFNEVSQNTMDSIAHVLVQRYPHDVKIQYGIKYHVKGEKTPPMSENSKYWLKKKDEIRYIAHNKQKMKKSDGSQILQQKQTRPPGVYAVEKDTTNIPIYTVGKKMGPLKLKNQYKNLVSISDIKTDYILIDFWAVWCAPCVGEIPNLKNVHDKYKDKFSVYAISLDNSEVEWKEGIEKYKCRQFNHVYAGSWADENARLITNSFGVNTIPANFLLDKNRNIIAKNLKGDDLERKMEELLK